MELNILVAVSVLIIKVTELRSFEARSNSFYKDTTFDKSGLHCFSPFFCFF